MKTRVGQKIKLTSYEELLSVPSVDGAQDIDLRELYEFKNHPFHVVDDEAMMELIESIKKNGILTPAIARKRTEGGYELISGHRRKHAAEIAGLRSIPVFVKDLDDDEATIMMVESNIQREEILPSEKAFAFKMKLEAMRHQGKTMNQEKFSLTCGTEFHKSEDSILGEENHELKDDTYENEIHKMTKIDIEKKSRDIIGKEMGISGRQVQKYIRLTEVIPELLEYVDTKRINLEKAVDISYLHQILQKQVYDYIKKGKTISKDKILRLRKLGNPEEDKQIQKKADLILNENTRTVKQVYFSLTDQQIASYFPKGYTKQQMEEVILSLLNEWSRVNSIQE